MRFVKIHFQKVLILHEILTGPCCVMVPRNELNIMVEDIDPHIIGITESWATPDISDAELGMTGYVMFRKDRLGRRGGGVIIDIKESIQACEIKLEK